jgi:hypothetical protein
VSVVGSLPAWRLAQLGFSNSEGSTDRLISVTEIFRQVGRRESLSPKTDNSGSNFS